MKENLKNYLCSTLVMCCFCSCSVFAQDDAQYTDKELQKCVSQLKMEGLSDQYLVQIEQLTYQQAQNRQFDKALNTAQYLINASKKYYGANHPRTGFAYIARARIYQYMALFNKSIQDLDIANSIYEKNPNDFDLANNVMLTYAMQYNYVQQYSKSISYLQKTLSKEYQYNGMSYVYNDLANAYTQSKEMKKALEYYDKQYKDLVSNNLAVSQNMFYYYLSIAGLYQNIGLYPDAAKNLEKAENLLAQLDDSNKSLLISLNKAKIMYLNEVRYFDESIALLSETEALVEKYGSTHDKEHIKTYYIDLYKDKKEYSKTYKYFNDIEKLYSNLPQDSLATLFPILEKKIEMYKDMQEFNKSCEALCNALRKLEMQKENAPSLYAYFLLKKFDLNKDENKLDEAKIALDTAFEYYKKSVPENSYEYFEVYKRYGQLNAHKGNSIEALKYYNKAKNINIALLGEVNRDLADIYADIANNVDNEKDAIAYINKSIDIRKACYGEKHQKVYSKLINKYHLYNKFEKHEEAAKLLEQINNDVNSKQIKGDTGSSIDYQLNLINAYNALSNNDTAKAELYANNALKYALTKKNKKQIYEIKYHIYSNTGNKLKAEKYKKLADIA